MKSHFSVCHLLISDGGSVSLSHHRENTVDENREVGFSKIHFLWYFTIYKVQRKATFRGFLNALFFLLIVLDILFFNS